MRNEKAERKLKEARSNLMFARPYYASAVYAMPIVLSDEVGALAVDDRWRLYANPGWIELNGVDVIATGIAHEAQHLLLDHAGRAKHANVMHHTMTLWNEASDCDINDGLMVDCQSQRPTMTPLPEKWCLLPKHFGMPDGLSAERYYSVRMANRAEEQRAEAGEVKEDGGKGDGGRGRAGRGLGHGCGSGASSVPAPWDVGSEEASGVPEVSDADAIDIRRRVAADVQAHASQKGRSSVAAGLLEWSDELLRPAQIRWDRELDHAVRRASRTTAGAVQHSYARTSRRQHAFGQVVAPAYRRPIPEVTFVVDTSLSMKDLRSRVRGVVDDACKRLAVPLRVIDVDAAVARETVVSSGHRVAQGGGGGTDMRVGIEQAMSRRQKPDCIVICTDCLTPWPSTRPSAHIIVAAIGASEESLAAIPPWATVIQIRDQDVRTP